jgi:hypothetical protein
MTTHPQRQFKHSVYQLLGTHKTGKGWDNRSLFIHIQCTAYLEVNGVLENEPEVEFIITENAYGYIPGSQGSDPISIF